MPSPRRILLPKTVVFITSRTIRGLPFVPAMNEIIESAVARAQALYPIKLCALKFMGNHFHAIIYVEEPSDVVGFIDRLKTETAHAVNILCGTVGVPVWKESYDSLPILTFEDVINKFVYLFANALSANLVAKIDQYPGVSTWHMFVKGIRSKEVGWIQRTMIKKQLAPVQKHNIVVTPFSWLKAFEKEEDEDTLKNIIMKRVLAAEKEVHHCIGKDALISLKIDRYKFKPKKYTKRTWCICRDRAKKVAFIGYIKSLISQARDVYTLWKKGDFTKAYPPHLFPPLYPKLANSIIGLSTL